MFNTILREAGLDIAEIILVRHQDQSAEKGRKPFDLWRHERHIFDEYQSIQGRNNRSRFDYSIWAAFVGTPRGETLFVGAYSARYRGTLDHDRPKPHMAGIDLAGTCDLYDLERLLSLEEFEGKMLINWGDGTRAWVQRADRQNKPVVELRLKYEEEIFPGFLNFIKPLSHLESLPREWVAILQKSWGVYLLTCPKTREQYVGSVTGDEGFWQRWMQYCHDGHGGNIALKTRHRSDYQVSILEVAGSAATRLDVLALEAHWKRKLQSVEMGLNRN